MNDPCMLCNKIGLCLPDEKKECLKNKLMLQYGRNNNNTN